MEDRNRGGEVLRTFDGVGFPEFDDTKFIIFCTRRDDGRRETKTLSREREFQFWGKGFLFTFERKRRKGVKSCGGGGQLEDMEVIPYPPIVLKKFLVEP